MTQPLPSSMSQNIPTTHSVAVSRWTDTLEDMASLTDRYAELRRVDAEQRKLQREQSPVKQYERHLIEERGFHPATIRIERIYRGLDPQSQSIVCIQTAILNKAAGRDKDMAYEEPSNDDDRLGPTFNRTTTGRRQGNGVSSYRRIESAVERTTVDARLLSWMIGELEAGREIKQERAGRKSNVWLATERAAHDEAVRRRIRVVVDNGEDQQSEQLGQ